MSNSHECQALVYNLTRFHHELGFGTVTTYIYIIYHIHVVLERAIPYTDGTRYGFLFHGGGGGGGGGGGF